MFGMYMYLLFLSNEKNVNLLRGERKKKKRKKKRKTNWLGEKGEKEKNSFVNEKNVNLLRGDRKKERKKKKKKKKDKLVGRKRRERKK